MPHKSQFQRDRRESNPAFSSRKLKFGTFQTNLDSGCVMSDLDGRIDITWPNTVALAKLSDEMEFEALVPVARWHGFGGQTNAQGPGFECYTWAAGISGATQKAGIVSTSHITLNHPVMAAKQSAVIDHISNGRYTLNIVCGWNVPEMEMFNMPMLGHQERYDCADEWVQIVRRLWTEDETFDFDGKFYQVKKGYLAPKPVQAPHPAIMNAAGSERGRHFACKNADLAFTVIRNPDPDVNKAHIEAYHTMARDYGREIRVWSLCNIVQGETEKEAREFYDYYVNQKGDFDGAANVITAMNAEVNERNYDPVMMRRMRESFVSSWGGHNIVGTKEQIIDGLKKVSAWGLDGVLLSFPRYEQGLREFRDVTYPLVQQAGLRDFL